MNGLCTPLSPSQQEHSRPRGMCGTGVCRKKAPPGEKPVAEHAAAQEAPEKENLHRAYLLPEARGRRGSSGKNSGIQVAETFLCPERRKTSRGSPTAQGKNWLWKRKLTRCAGSPTTPERKNALPVLHGRSEGDFPRFRVTPQAGRTPMPGGILQKKYSIPRETPPKQEVRQAVSSGRKFPPSGKPPGQDRRKGNSHRGAVPALLFAASLSARACAHTTESQRPPGRNTNRSTQAGPRYTESRYRPFPQRNMFRPAPSAVHVPSSHGKTPSPIPRREGCGIFSLPEGREQKKALQEDEVRLKAAGL